jgi:hypothetical protein
MGNKFDENVDLTFKGVIFKDSTLGKDSFKFKSLSKSPFGVILAMQKNQVGITAFVEYNIHSTGIETVAGFHIVSIDDIENTLL